jgi:hypothetical protein
MQIQDFNGPPSAAPVHEQGVAGNVADPTQDMDRAGIEIALLKTRIEHLELVVETARSLMTSNQEKLLRRLHDLPQEMVALSARLSRLNDLAPVRRVA